MTKNQYTLQKGPQKPDIQDRFMAGWETTIQKWVPAVRITSAVLKLTNAGEESASLKQLAALAGLSSDQTAGLAAQIFPKTARIQGGDLFLDLSSTRQPSSRYELRIGHRRIYAEGCAPDQFWIALFIPEPVEIRAVCQATGSPIRMIVSASGVEGVEPSQAMVGLINPLDVQAVDFIEEFDQKICVYQTFYASPEAGGTWKLQHPQGKLLSVHDFFDFWRQLLTPIVADLMVHPAPS
jgi:alkylmercury lyase